MHRLQDPGRNQGKTIGLTLSIPTPSYIGRFAPSPTGPLHLGSLYTALASFLDARQHSGRWLLRIDDLDAPRNMPGAIPAILDCLQRFGLHWDGEIYYQSQHVDAYLNAIGHLQQQEKIYACACSRKRLAAFPGVYPGFCRNLRHPDDPQHALRVKTTHEEICFVDRLEGPTRENLARQHGDFIIKRKDGIIAYQLAVVVDDHIQQVNQVVRGFDLLDSTGRQVFLHHLLDYPLPEYMHVPIIVDCHGDKLSKQTCAQAVDISRPAATLFLLLQWLKQNPPDNLRHATVDEMLHWAIAHWQPQSLKKIRAIEQAIT